MIPKIIHYCWFGNKKPRKIQNTIEQWKNKLPNYKFMEWNESNVDFSKMPNFAREAFDLKKWAFVSDFVRLWALYQYGGIYLDTDVEVVNDFESFLKDSLSLSFESEKSLCTAIICSEKCNPIIGDFLQTYYKKSFVVNNTIDNTPNSELLFTFLCSKNFELKFEKEFINDFLHIYPRTIFGAKDIHSYKLLVTERTVAIHHLDASWYSPTRKILKRIKKVVMKIINMNTK